MASKKQILKKVKILLTQSFEKPEDAFNFFDSDGDKNLSRKELKRLLQSAKVSGFISGIASKKMIKGLDKNADKKLNWDEFKKAVDALLVEGDTKK